MAAKLMDDGCLDYSIFFGRDHAEGVVFAFNRIL
jgi:hypothetical protein